MSVGTQFWKYIPGNKNPISDDYPKLINDHWRGISNNIDATFKDTNGHVYFFKGNVYYRLKKMKKDIYNVSLYANVMNIALLFIYIISKKLGSKVIFHNILSIHITFDQLIISLPLIPSIPII